MSTHSLKVEPENNNLRLDVFLTQNLPDSISRTHIKRLIDAFLVQVNGKNVKANYHVKENDQISVKVPDEELPDEKIQPEKIQLDIFYEDDVLLIVNKPSGMLVHPATGIYTGTLVNALIYHCKHLSDAADSSEGSRPGIVHRLDQETSGLLVVAKNNAAHVNLTRQFEKHNVKKKYLALVEGLIEFDEGLIDEPLGRHPRYHDKKAVVYSESGKKAKTFYKVIKRFKNATFVALFPKTGRTHQLRVHMAHLGHPILGDEKYGKKSSFARLALHAQGLGFHHPGTTKYIEFSVVPPQEFLEYV